MIVKKILKKEVEEENLCLTCKWATRLDKDFKAIHPIKNSLWNPDTKAIECKYVYLKEDNCGIYCPFQDNKYKINELVSECESYDPMEENNDSN